MESELVLSVGAYFEVQLLLVCLDPGGSPNDLLVDLFGSSPWPVAPVAPSQVSFILGTVEDRPVAVACEDFDFKDSFRARDFESDVIWLVPKTNLEGLRAQDLLLRLDSYLLAVDVPERTTDLYPILEYFGTKKKILRVSRFATWSPGMELAVPQPAIWERRNDFGGVELVNTVLPWRPMITLEDEEDGTIVISGLLPDLLAMFRSVLNFTVVNVRPDDSEWGVLLEDTDPPLWTGLVGDLQSGRADFCGSTVSMTKERMDAIGFTAPILEDTVTLIMANPALAAVADSSHQEFSFVVYLKIFTQRTWVAMSLMAVLASSAYARLDGFGSRRIEGGASNYLRGLNFFFLSLIQRGEDPHALTRASSKVFFVCLSLFAFVVYNFYVGDLTATMTVGKSNIGLVSFQDVLDGQYTVYILAGSLTDAAFQTSSARSAKHQVYDSRVVKVESSNNYQEGMKRAALESPGNVLAYESIFTFAGDNDLALVSEFKDTIQSPLGFGLRKDSELRGAFNHYLLKAVQSGLLRNLQHKWLEGERPTDHSNRIFLEEARALGYRNLFFPAVVFAVGAAAGAAALALEFGAVKVKRMRSTT